MTSQGSLFGDEAPWDAPVGALRAVRRQAAADLYATIHAELAGAVVGHAAAVAQLALVGVYHIHGAQGQRPLLWGEPGVGKTTLAKALAHCLGAPCTTVNVPDLVETGYHGTQIGDVLGRVFAQDPEGAQALPMVILTQFDALCSDEPVPPFAGVGAEVRHGLQRSLLGLFEGSPVTAHYPAAFGQPAAWRPVPTARVLVVCTGAFPGVPPGRLDAAALVARGVLPELAAHIGPILALGPHTSATVGPVLERALQERRRLAEACGVTLRIDPGLLRAVARGRGRRAPSPREALAVLKALIDRGMAGALQAGVGEVHLTPDDLDWGSGG